MEIIFLVGLVIIGLVIYVNYSKRDIPADVVKTDQGDAPYKVETPVPAADVAPQPVIVEGAGPVDVAPVVTEVVETGKVLDKVKKPAARKTAAAKTPAKKPVAKKTVAVKKPAAKKKSA